MGYGFCRVEGCKKGTNTDHLIAVYDGKNEYLLLICGMWKHYSQDHKFQPTEKEQRIVMNSEKLPESRAEAETRQRIMFVERTPEGYDHKQGESPDENWIAKLDKLIKGSQDILYMGKRR